MTKIKQNLKEIYHKVSAAKKKAEELYKKYKITATNEAAYKGNIGFEETMKIMLYGTKSQQDELEKLMKANDWKGMKTFFHKHLGVKLV